MLKARDGGYVDIYQPWLEMKSQNLYLKSYHLIIALFRLLWHFDELCND
jgi:hypothetical protein